MSISIKNRATGVVDQINLESDFITIIFLKKMIGIKYDLPQNNLQKNLRIFTRDHVQREYEFHEFVKKGQRIEFQLVDAEQKGSKEKKEKQTNQQNKKLGIVSPQQLQSIINDSKIYMIKSANEENIQKSKDLSLWATTFSNQERLKYSFNNLKHVLLLFATNRSFQIKGLARMESQPDKMADKSVWVGVSNIRLGGNFKIKWLRKKPLSLTTVQKSMGNLFKQSILRSCDGQEIDPISCKPLAFLFQTPTEAYYPLEVQLQIKQKISQKKVQPTNMQFIPSFFMPPSMGLFPNPLMPQLVSHYNYPNFEQIQSKLPKKQQSEKSSQEKMHSKKHKKSSKQKKFKKMKKNKRKYLTSSQSESDSSKESSSSYQSSYSDSYKSKSIKKYRKKKKDRKISKDRKKSSRKEKRSKKQKQKKKEK